MDQESKPSVAVPEQDPGPQRTWNTAESIARHRQMSPDERLKKAIALSQAALRFARAPGERAR